MFSLHLDTARSWRGGQRQVLLTVLGLRARGERAALVAHPDGELYRRASEGVDLIPLAIHGELDLNAGWRLSRIIRRLQPQVVHAHDPHAVAAGALALSLAPGSPRPPLVASRRVDFHLKGTSLSRWKYRQVDMFVAASDAIRRMLLTDGTPADRAVTIHEGIDIHHVVRTPPANVHAEFWLPTHAPIVGNVAALVPHKGHRHLIDAAALVVRELPDVRFLIFGEGELHGALAGQIRAHRLDKHVLLCGFREDVLALIKSIDLFVMSSVTEGLGTSLLDAMAAARPIVATTAGGIPEVVIDGETGLLVPPRDHRAMAAAIAQLLKEPARRAAMGAAGQARVREKFNVERMVDETLRLYEHLVDTPHGADSVRRAEAG